MIFIYLIFLLSVFTAISGRLLAVNDNPKKVDVIIVLSGDDGRLEKGVSLYNSGFSRYLMLSNATADQTTVENATRMGVPFEDIISELHADSTYTNATLTKEIMLQRGFKSAIIVTSNYHSGRSKFIFDKVYKDANIDLIYCSSKPGYNLNYWWTSKKGINTVFNEYVKFIWYALRY
jgi:uncharacterized SAM-binding protein YcdF (DUF218 family)